MIRLVAFLLLLMLAFPVKAQVLTLQMDENAVPIQDFLRLGSPRTVPLGPTSLSVNPLNDRTRVVLVVCSAACNIQQGPSPFVATTDSFLLPANVILRLRVIQGDAISFVGTSGTAYVVEMH